MTLHRVLVSYIFMMLTYIIPLYLVSLIYLSSRKLDSTTVHPLREAWVWLIAIAFTQAFFSLLSLSSNSTTGALYTVSQWKDVVTWGLLGMSLLKLSEIVVQPIVTSRDSD